MKRKLLLTTLSILLSVFAFSQNYTLTDADNSNDITNSAITKTGDANASTVAHDIYVTNNTTSTVELKAFRREISMVGSSYTSICFAGQCYPPATDTSSQSVSLGAGQTATSNGLICDFYPDGNSGTSIVDYVIFNKNNLSDSVSVRVTYDITTDINGNYVSNSLIAYPNPAQNQINFKYSLNKKSYINIYNVVGKKINTINLDSNQGVYTLNTNKYNSGIYFYEFVVNGKKVSINKFVVSH